MKISIASDVHLEFGDLDIRNTDSADVLILSGDICVAQDLGALDSYNIRGEADRSNRIHGFFERCAAEFSCVIYVVGNHEHYHGDFATTVPRLKEHLGYIKNLHILDREIIQVADVTFIGGTLWTDMNKRDPLTLYHMTSMMNDFRCVQNSLREVTYKAYEQINGVDNRERPIFKTRPARFSPEDAADEFDRMTGYIRSIVDGKIHDNFVVVGHHSPSRKSTHPRYANDIMMNGGYSSDLDEFIFYRPQIRLWTHGHTHHEFDYRIGDTRIVCNPRGYIGYEEQADQWKLKTVEI